MSRAHSVSFRSYLLLKLMFEYAKDEVTFSETARVTFKGVRRFHLVIDADKQRSISCCPSCSPSTSSLVSTSMEKCMKETVD